MMNDMVWGKQHFLMVIPMKEDMRTEKDMEMELIVLEILPNMLENILKGEDTDMAHFGIQVYKADSIRVLHRVLYQKQHLSPILVYWPE